MPNLLILSTTFFPDPNVASVRVTEWAKWLPTFGWTPYVVCRHSGYESTPEALADAVHADVRVTRLGPRVTVPDKLALYGIPRTGLTGAVRRLVEQLAVPDVSIVRWRALEQEAIRVGREIRPDVVLSSSPSTSIHWLGRRIARAVRAKWIADFRDPYTIDPRFSPRGLLSALLPLHRRYERAVYRDADLAIHAIPLHGRWARLKYPEARAASRILTNGAPHALFSVPNDSRSTDGERISIRAVGYLAPDAIPHLAAAIERLVRDGIDAEFVHAGPIPDGVRGIPRSVFDRFVFRGKVAHPRAIELVRGADLLLSYLARARSEYILISSKLFEYLATGTPILAVNPTRCDRQLLRRFPQCQSLTHPSSDEFVDAVHGLTQERGVTGVSPPFEIRFDRKAQAKQLASWLDELIFKADDRNSTPVSAIRDERLNA